MSIYFDIPAGTYNGRAVSATTVKVDRGFSEENSIKVFEHKAADYPLQFVKVDGINERSTKITFTIKNKNTSDYLDILKYFESLKGCKAITLNYPDASTKKIIIVGWNSSLNESNYSSLQVNAELVYL